MNQPQQQTYASQDGAALCAAGEVIYHIRVCRRPLPVGIKAVVDLDLSVRAGEIFGFSAKWRRQDNYGPACCPPEWFRPRALPAWAALMSSPNRLLPSRPSAS